MLGNFSPLNPNYCGQKDSLVVTGFTLRTNGPGLFCAGTWIGSKRRSTRRPNPIHAMTTTESIGNPVITVEGATYVIKVGSTNRFPDHPREMTWYVVAFACDPGWPDVPLAGPFETRLKAAEALDLYLSQASYPSMAWDEVVRATKMTV
jgi:hypothetical protein